MNAQQQKAMEGLKSILSLLTTVRKRLEEVKKKFEVIGYYHDFKLHVDSPNPLPIEVAEQFTLEMIENKKLMLEFKESFNENELTSDLRKSFLEIFLIIVKDGLVCRNNEVYLGGVVGWEKSTTYILNKWSNYGYNIKTSYSRQAFEMIKSYFKLINLIEDLEAKLS